MHFVLYFTARVHLVRIPKLQCLLFDVICTCLHQQLHQSTTVHLIVCSTMDRSLPILITSTTKKYKQSTYNYQETTCTCIYILVCTYTCTYQYFQSRQRRAS